MAHLVKYRSKVVVDRVPCNAEMPRQRRPLPVGGDAGLVVRHRAVGERLLELGKGAVGLGTACRSLTVPLGPLLGLHILGGRTWNPAIMGSPARILLLCRYEPWLREPGANNLDHVALLPKG